VEACAFSPDGRKIISGSGDGTLKLWDAANPVELRTLKGHGNWVYACSFSPDGRRIVSGSDNGKLKLWDAHTGRELRTLEGHTAWVLACSFSRDGRRILSGSQDRTLKVWDAETGAELLTFEDANWVYACGFSPDGRRIVSGGAGLKLWDAETGAELQTLSQASGVTDCAFAPDGHWIVSGNMDGTLKLWEGGSDSVVADLRVPGVIRSVAVHPMLTTVVCGSESGAIYRVELEGIDYGPIVATAVQESQGSTLRCPKCWEAHPLDDAWLGQVIECPTPGCGLSLRVNPFVAGSSMKRMRKRLFGRRG
jgi:WD40 repeat protein